MAGWTRDPKIETFRTDSLMKAILGVFAACFLEASAELVFRTKLVEVHASPDAKVVTAEFPFEVKGGEGGEIFSYDAPCSCLTARVLPLNPDRSTKLKWAEGESGKIVGRFEMGNFKGTIDKAIFLNVKGSKEKVKLIVRVHIPVLFAIEPSTHQWELNAPATTKVFKIKVNHTDPIHLKKVMGQMQEFPYELVTIQEGWEYEVMVTPKSTATPGMGRLAFYTDSIIDRYKRQQVFTVVSAQREK